MPRRRARCPQTVPRRRVQGRWNPQQFPSALLRPLQNRFVSWIVFISRFSNVCFPIFGKQLFTKSYASQKARISAHDGKKCLKFTIISHSHHCLLSLPIDILWVFLINFYKTNTLFSSPSTSCSYLFSILLPVVRRLECWKMRTCFVFFWNLKWKNDHVVFSSALVNVACEKMSITKIWWLIYCIFCPLHLVCNDFHPDLIHVPFLFFLNVWNWNILFWHGSCVREW